MEKYNVKVVMLKGEKGERGEQGIQGLKGDKGVVDQETLNTLATYSYVNGRLDSFSNQLSNVNQKINSKASMETVNSMFSGLSSSYSSLSSGVSRDIANVKAMADDKPVGTIYMNNSSTDPSSKLGGTWVEIGTQTIGTETIHFWKKTQD